MYAAPAPPKISNSSKAEAIAVLSLALHTGDYEQALKFLLELDPPSQKDITMYLIFWTLMSFSDAAMANDISTEEFLQKAGIEVARNST